MTVFEFQISFLVNMTNLYMGKKGHKYDSQMPRFCSWLNSVLEIVSSILLFPELKSIFPGTVKIDFFGLIIPPSILQGVLDNPFLLIINTIIQVIYITIIRFLVSLINEICLKCRWQSPWQLAYISSMRRQRAWAERSLLGMLASESSDRFHEVLISLFCCSHFLPINCTWWFALFAKCLVFSPCSFGALVTGWVCGSLLVPNIPSVLLHPTWTLELVTSLVVYVFLFLSCTFLK